MLLLMGVLAWRSSEKTGNPCRRKNRFTVNSNKDAPHRHSRAGGNPESWNCCNF
ncbi:hypothetical protein NEIMUCOT_04162 [Neisseria mucosa ATCC 25996]|uniref:Uncharacterized protein n=1 Tax=Neisseria mucosa (strain ATCC 25996 / DSM 4631 / NCTC 10774 / M26) TaxID=546266 RepID=D2ZU74_NEIM2|nr:hypothetical protein NEIMUCOT_04162 [Neisseria mucosa ATCC 25996]